MGAGSGWIFEHQVPAILEQTVPAEAKRVERLMASCWQSQGEEDMAAGAAGGEGSRKGYPERLIARI
jgi:hypothetical protein